MATSGTYNFNPSLGELILYAFELCGIRPTALAQEHFVSARMAANMLQGRWSSQGVNLWQVDLQTTPLVQGQATYDVLPDTIVMLDTYVTIGSGSSAIDRIIMPISRSEYATYANKEQQGFPTVFWNNRQLAPTVTVWPVPDGNENSLKYYRLRQTMDANLGNATTVEIPVYFLEAFAYGVAQRLATIWAPDRAVGLKALADESYQIAVDQNIETANFYVSPSLSSYFR